MTEKIIQPKLNSLIPNLLYTPDLTLASVNDLTYLYSSEDKNTPANYDVQAVGTITMAGIAVLNETFIIDAETFTWKNTRTVAFEFALGTTAAQACTNLIAAINADMATVVASAGAGTTVKVTTVEYGDNGNTYTFSENCTNMSMDGSGFLGGTTAGADNYLELEHIDITGQGYPAILTADDIFSSSNSLNWNEEVGIVYCIKLYNNTTSTQIIAFNMFVFTLVAYSSVVLTDNACEPSVKAVETLVAGSSYTWSLSFKKHRTGTSTIAATSKSRLLTIQEIKR
jgi:hypothetical protein